MKTGNLLFVLLLLFLFRISETHKKRINKSKVYINKIRIKKTTHLEFKSPSEDYHVELIATDTKIPNKETELLSFFSDSPSGN